ncbi:8091_t:CDS:2 [Paraglomus occultum]|uniref:8091_t:CDS:1 n=1 Tax=Paraglomus occultum TaxID=144539 RepID=A0A9N9GCX4_9GLOM|nr:8091_t:CDS:2 [Paraglomus occultum]
MTSQQTDNTETAVSIPEPAATTQNRNSNASRLGNAPPYTAKYDVYLDDEAPAYTIIDTSAQRRAVKNDKRVCGGCIPERNAVVAVFALYFFLGVVYTAIALAGLVFNGSAYDKTMSFLDFVLSVMMTAAGICGMRFVYAENANRMRKLACVLWFITLARLTYSSIDFAYEVIHKQDSINNCNDAVREYAEENGEYLDADCDAAVRDQLIRDGLNLFLFETLQVYFAFIVFRYAKRMGKTAKSPLPLSDGGHVNNLPPTYAVYAARVPTSSDWIPPP